ncbi:MAG: histidine phosphatase family protein [Gemmataceae bacterium]|nr:histidine phosphatase family protein [Gemmataceae bacterium]
MSEPLPAIYLARHGETAWALSGQHTGLTDIPLTERGERNARNLGERLKGITFTRVFSSPSQRARRTGDLAGFGDRVEVDQELHEWDYGAYEGKKTVDILKEKPGWNIFKDGCPNGESLSAISARADRVLARLRPLDGNVLVFSSGHFLRVVAARWLGLEAAGGRMFLLSTATLSILGYEHNKNEPIIRLWNDGRHVTQ